jgi:hypothetical protein
MEYRILRQRRNFSKFYGKLPGYFTEFDITSSQKGE